MALIAQAQKSLRILQLGLASNAFTCHVPIDLDGQNKVIRYVQQAQTRLERPFEHAPKSALDGQILTVKDNLWTARSPTTCASGMLQGFEGPRNANVVNGLEDAGMLIIGKTNMDEFGMGSHSRNSYYGPVKNNTLGGSDRSAGGSSGGGAMAVLKGQCRIALASDTGGSVRLPAAYTGLIGFKPTYGRLSRHGLIPYANSLDTVGFIGRRCVDIMTAFGGINRPDICDPTCIDHQTRWRIAEAKKMRRQQKLQCHTQLKDTRPGSGREQPAFPSSKSRRRPRTAENPDWSFTIGVPVEYNIEEMSDAVREAWVRTLSQLEEQGHSIVPVSLPHTKAALPAYYVLAPAEASSNLAKYDGVRYGLSAPNPLDDSDDNNNNNSTGSHPDTDPNTYADVLFARIRGAGFGPEVQRRILLGTYTLSSTARDNYFIQAQKVRRLVQRDFDSVFKVPNPLHRHHAPPEDGVDYIICPTAPTAAPYLSELQGRPKPQSPTPSSSSAASAPWSEISQYTTDLFTVPASLAGIPAISVPAPLNAHSQYPGHRNIGIQVLAQCGDDMSLLKFVLKELEPTKPELHHYAKEQGMGKKRYL